MRTPSRRMPKYVPRPVTWVGWLVQVGIVVAIIGILWQAPKVLWFLPVAVVCSLFDNRQRKRRLQTMAAARAGESICTFARAFDCSATDTWIIRAVYEQLQEHLKGNVAAFPVRPEDNIVKELGIDPDDLGWDIMDEIATRTGRSLENTERNPFGGKVETVGDLVQFFLHQPNTQSPAGKPD